MAILADRITSDPERCGGRPCVRDLRIRVVDILEMLASGMTQEQIVAEHPSLEVEDVYAALLYASKQVDHAVLSA
jgi:uncharacterized protein (DUF433 family)